MAEGKKSFIAYSDWKNTFDELPNEEAGMLIKHIFAYVNDENPQTDSVLIKAVFANIKSTLKRDLDRWESQLIQRSNAGKRSAEIRLAKSNDRSTTVNEVQRNSTDSVNVSVSVNDSVNEKKINVPTEIDFLNYCKELMKDKYQSYEFSLQAKYAAWVSDGWKDGNKAAIKNWKTKIANTIPYLKPISFKQPESKMVR